MSRRPGTLVDDQQICDATDQRQWWRWRPADVFGNLVLQAAAQGGPCLALRPFPAGRHPGRDRGLHDHLRADLALRVELTPKHP
jgi:hypothetical protein